MCFEVGLHGIDVLKKGGAVLLSLWLKIELRVRRYF